MRSSLLLLAMTLPLAASSPAVDAINRLGLELQAISTADHPGGNSLLSPYSIQTALAMTYAGADGVTRAEMARVLHYEGDEAALHQSFRELSDSLKKVVAQAPDTISFNVANRLFGQKGFAFKQPFLSTVADLYGAPLEPLDFMKAPLPATRHINQWVATETRDRIRDLIPPDLITIDTRLVLVNALHMKAPWENEFVKGLTANRTFHLMDGSTVQVPTLHQVRSMSFQQFDGFKAVGLPYKSGSLQFLVIVPDATNGLAAVEAKLDARTLAACARLDRAEVDLYLPKLKMEPGSMQLGAALSKLGMKTAFNIPPGSADFGRMAPPQPDRLAISEVVHKTFLELDEKGTEAAAATAVIITRSAAFVGKPTTPVVVRADRPFLFAIQHVDSKACLFLGRVTDPRK